MRRALPGMNEVPSIEYPVGRSYRLGVSLVGLWFVGGMAVSAWLLDQSHSRAVSAWRLGVLLFSLALSAAALIAFWRSQRQRKLVFDGDQWHLTDADTSPAALPENPARVAILWDAQHCMLLRWPSVNRGTKRVQWLWADASSDPWRWHLLRCALYSPANRPDAEIPDGSARG